MGYSDLTSSQIAKWDKANKNGGSLLNPINPLQRLEKEDINRSKYMDYMCHDTLVDPDSGKYIFNIPRSDPGTPEDLIIFVALI